MGHLTRKERLELAELDRLYPQQWLMPGELQPRYYDLFEKDEADYRDELARLRKWERRQPALRTIADVAFWGTAIPFFVLMALAGMWMNGAMTVALAWLAFRCEWTLLPWKRKR